MVTARDILSDPRATPAAKAAVRAAMEKKPKGKASKRAGVMNQTETRYAEHLAILKIAGEIRDFAYEARTFTLSDDRCRWTPDFEITMPDGSLEYVDVKGGHTWEDAVIKFKWAASKFPQYRFRMIEYRSGAWVVVRDSWKGRK